MVEAWRVGGVSYRLDPPGREWKAGGLALIAHKRAWNPRLHPRDWRGRFARKPGSRPSRGPDASAGGATASGDRQEPTTRPTLYTAARNRIFAMGFEDDPSQPDTVREAVARLRTRQGITAPMARDLAEAIRGWSDRPEVPERSRRANYVTAAFFDAQAVEIESRTAPRGHSDVTPSPVGELAKGDVVALVGPDSSVDVVTVREVSPGTPTMTLLDVEHTDGRQERRNLLSKTTAYKLPPPPPDEEVPPPASQREHIHPDRLNPGDVVEVNGVRSTVVRSQQRDRVTWLVTFRDADGNLAMENYRSLLGAPAVIRVERGQKSSNQLWDQAMPPENPTPVSAQDVKVGDRIHIEGLDEAGSVIDVREGGDGDVHFTLRTDSGQTTEIQLRGLAGVTRLVEADDHVSEWIRQQEAISQISRIRGVVAADLANYQLQVRETALRIAGRSRSPEDAADNVREMMGDRYRRPTEYVSDALVQMLAPEGSPEDHLSIAESVKPIVDEVALQELHSIARAFQNMTPLPGEDGRATVERVIATLQKKPRPAPGVYQDVADPLAQLYPRLKDIAEGLGISGEGLPRPPRRADLKRRMGAYREAIGPEFGKRPVARHSLRTSLADLKAGKLPRIEKVTVLKEDVARDGGPGELAMRHLEVLRAAGKDLDREVQKRMKTLQEESKRRIEEIDARRGKLSDQSWKLMEQQYAQQVVIRERLAKEEGFDNVNHLMSDLFQARDRGDGDEVQRLEGIRDRLLAKAGAETSSIDEDLRKIQKEDLDLIDRLYRERVRENIARRKTVLEVISEARGEPMGGTLDFSIRGPEFDDYKNFRTFELTEADKADLAEAMKFATDSYPRSWMEKLRARGSYRLKRAERAYHSEPNKVIAFSEYRPNSPEAGRFGEVAVHEVGHGMERAIPGLIAAENALMWSRTATGEIGRRKRPQAEQIYAGSEEYGWRDDFRSHYTGKNYDGRNFEIFTTGIQELLGGGGGYLDKDMNHWILGVLALL